MQTKSDKKDGIRMDAAEIIDQFKEIVTSHYLDVLLENTRKGKFWIEISFAKIAKHNPMLADSLLDDPDETLKAAEIAGEQLIGEGTKEIKIRITNLPKSQRVPIRNIRSQHIDKLICIEGIITTF